jgi:hypothetical protein
MNETNLQVLTGDWEPSFPRHYQIKAFFSDASRLRDLARKRTREHLTEAELAELPDLRKRLRRVDSDSILLLILKRGGYNFV